MSKWNIYRTFRSFNADDACGSASSCDAAKKQALGKYAARFISDGHRVLYHAPERGGWVEY